MNRKVAEHMKELIDCLGFVDKLGGLVYTKAYKNPKGKEVKAPVYKDGTEELRFTPDENKKSVIYFEQRTPEKVIDHALNSWKMYSEIACIGWLNDRKLGSEDLEAWEAVLPIVNAIAIGNPIHDSPISNLNFTFKEQLTGDKTLFNKYTYSEFKDYINGPYTAFGIVFRCEWYVPQDCINDLKMGAKLC